PSPTRLSAYLRDDQGKGISRRAPRRSIRQQRRSRPRKLPGQGGERQASRDRDIAAGESDSVARRKSDAAASGAIAQEEEGMADFLQLIISGTATGAIYALCALGFTLLWQASGTINFAQGEFVMLPAFMMLFFINTAGLPLWLAFLLTCLVAMLLLGYTFKRAIVDPLIRHGVIPMVMATLGLSIGVKQLTKAGVTAQAMPFNSPFP